MKRILFSTCLLAACLTACNNEDVLNESPVQNATEEASVVGADLVSHGMKIRINGNDASTRVAMGDNGETWETSDQIGLAWYNFKADGNIYDAQSKSDWNADISTFNQDDNKLYANHIFTVEDVDGVDQFTTMTDVYQGAYFAYFPYERLGGVKVKTVEFNAAPQTTDFDSDRSNKAFRVSTQDFIAADEVVGQNNELEKQFALQKVVNTLKIDVAPSEDIKGSTYFQSVKVTKLQINAGGNSATSKPFITKADLIPSKLPKVILNKEGGIDFNKSYEAIWNAAKEHAFIGNYESNVSNVLNTNIAKDDYTLANTRTVRTFVFPVNSLVTYPSAQYPTATVTVSKTQNGKTWTVGTFAINNTNSKGFAEKLRSYLTDGTNGVSKADKQLDAIIYSNYIVGNVALTVDHDAAANLELANFKPTLNITSIDQWNDMVALYDALYELGAIDKLAATYREPTFIWGGTESFNGEIQTPANVQIKLKTTKPMVIEGDVTWPKNLITDGDEDITVKGTLRVGETEEVIINANLTNEGTIYAGGLASIGVNKEPSENTVTNNGRIYVTYGAYVYPKSASEGEIAYIIDNNDKSTVNKIAKLVGEGTSSTQQNYANVNLLVIQNTTLDLSAVGDGTSGTDDRYESTQGQTVNMPDLKDVAIELNNGHITNTSGVTKKVKSVTALAGTTDTMTDIDINDDSNNALNIVTEAKSNLTVDVTADVNGLKRAITFNGSLSNFGNLTVLTDMNVTNVFNESTGYITVENGKTVTYTATYKQEGTAKGNIQKQN